MLWRVFATPLSDSRRATAELPSTSAFKEKWLQEAIEHNEATRPHDIMDMLQRFPLQYRSTSGGFRAPGVEGAQMASSVSDSVAGDTAAAFSSYTLLKSEKRVHRRLPMGPTSIYSEPVTGNMIIGWSTSLQDPKRLYAKDQQSLRRNPTGGYRGRIGCDETKYAEALILGPRHA